MPHIIFAKRNQNYVESELFVYVEISYKYYEFPHDQTYVCIGFHVKNRFLNEAWYNCTV